MAFDKTKAELREIVAQPVRNTTILALVAIGIALLALIIAVKAGK